MKTISALPVVLFLSMTIHTPLRGAASESLVLLSPQGGTYYWNSPLTITWSHPDSHAGKNVFLSISLKPLHARPAPTETQYPIFIRQGERIAVPKETPAQGERIWQIPHELPPGPYRVEVAALVEDDLNTLVWDQNSETIVITPQPKMVLRSREQPERIQSGSSPEFRFTMEAWGTNRVQAILLREKEVVGQLLGHHAYEGENGSYTGSVTWELTRYFDAEGRHFAPQGEGYRVLLGILKREGYKSDVLTDGFASFDETEPFAVVGAPPPLSLQKLRGKVGFGLYIYVVGEPRKEYGVFHSSVLPPLSWEQIWADKTDGDGILTGIVSPRRSVQGYFRSKQLSASLFNTLPSVPTRGIITTLRENQRGRPIAFTIPAFTKDTEGERGAVERYE